MKNFGLFVVLSSLLSLVGCGQPPAKPHSSVDSGNSQARSDDSTVILGKTMSASLASFETNLYKPLLKPFCASCHKETFGDQDINRAHAAFLARSGFDKFSGIELTLPVLKMKQAHNCWATETEICTTMMTEKMTLWLGDLQANGFKPTPVTYPFLSSEVAMATAAPVVLDLPPEYAGAAVDKAVIAAPFVLGTDDVDGPIKSYASAPEATARVVAVPAAAATTQSVTFTVNAKVAGTYFVWARIKTLAATSDEFFIQQNAAAPVQFIAPITGKDAWKWAQVMIVAGTANTINPYSFAVAAPGPQTMKVVFREGAAKINYLVITTKADFNGELFSNSFFDIPVDIKVPGVDGAKIIATVWEKTTEEGKKSLGVKELRIQSPVPLHVKTIYPLINGIFSSNNGTYTLVDTVAGGPDATKAVISTGGSTASTWLADMKLDKLIFAFELIEVAAK